MNNNSKDKFGLLDLFKSIWFFLGNNKREFVVWNVIIFVMFFYKLVPAFVVGVVVDFFINYKQGDSLSLFYFYCIFLGVLHIIVSLIRLTAKKKLGGISERIRYDVKVLGFEKLLNLSVKWHETGSSGTNVQKINNGANGVKDFVKLLYGEIFPIIVVFIGVLGNF